MRRLLGILLFGLALGAGVAIGWRLIGSRSPPPPDPPAVVERIREVAQLETLRVSLYRKVTFSPEPLPADSLWGDLAGWIRYSLRRPQGKAIVFADASIRLDVAKLGPGSVAVRGRAAFIVLPPLEVRVELRPGETEVIGSNLDSAETARLLELAARGFQRQVEADRMLRARARAASERALTALLLQAGLDRVEFVESLPAAPGS